MLTKDQVRKILGAILFAYGIYPFVYSRFDNVENTGNAAADEIAEGVHDTVSRSLRS